MKTKFLVLADVILNVVSIRKVVKNNYGNTFHIDIYYEEINYKGEMERVSHKVTFTEQNKCDEYFNDIAKQISNINKD